jgi:hypothetical protein
MIRHNAYPITDYSPLFIPMLWQYHTDAMAMFFPFGMGLFLGKPSGT